MLKMSEKTLVVQHNAVVEARYRLTVEEQRLIKTLVSQIQITDEDFKTYTIRVFDLAKLIGISDDYYYTRIKKLTKKLRDSSIVFTNENGDEVQTGWLSSAIYRKGKGSVELRFDPVLKPYLLQLKKFFTSYELGNILHLNGMYSIRIYELLKQYEKIGRREFKLEDLRHVLGIDSEYRQYRDFKKWVLLPSEKEISEKTDITYSVVEAKRGRKVIGLTFVINGNDQKSQAPVEKQECEPIAQIEEPKQADQVVEEMVGLGVVRSMAEELAKEFDKEHIRARIAHVLALGKDGKVKNPAGFLVEAIRKGYRDQQAEERERKDKAEREAKAREEHARKWERLKTAYTEARNSTFDGWLLTQDESFLAGQRESYLAHAPMLKKHPAMAEKAVTAYLKSLMPFPGLKEWAEQIGIDVAGFALELAREGQQAGVKAVSPETAA